MNNKIGIRQIFVLPAIGLLWIYQTFISKLIPPSCIYYPSCSEYSKQAFLKHGLLLGLYLTISRLLRCHPFHVGGVDEVPDRVSFFEFQNKPKA